MKKCTLDLVILHVYFQSSVVDLVPGVWSPLEPTNRVDCRKPIFIEEVCPLDLCVIKRKDLVLIFRVTQIYHQNSYELKFIIWVFQRVTLVALWDAYWADA